VRQWEYRVVSLNRFAVIQAQVLKKGTEMAKKKKVVRRAWTATDGPGGGLPVGRHRRRWVGAVMVHRMIKKGLRPRGAAGRDEAS
jgi:hypothetical protein